MYKILSLFVSFVTIFNFYITLYENILHFFGILRHRNLTGGKAYYFITHGINTVLCVDIECFEGKFSCNALRRIRI